MPITTRTVRATVSERALQSAPLMFASGLTSILTEMLQNARRAGATEILVRQDGDVVSIADDGSGIADPEALLSFGASGWDARTQSAELSAGMGFWSLAARGAHVMTSDGSRGWNAAISPEAFRGEADISVQHVPGGVPGTTVSFRAEGKDGTRGLRDLVASCSRFYPLPVRFAKDDDEPEELTRIDFLAGAEKVIPFESGRIGIFEGSHSTRDDTINFFGLVVKTDTAEVRQLYGPSHYAKFDLTSASGVQLALPARTEVVKNDAWAGLLERAETEIYRFLAEQDGHGLSFESYERGRALGVDLAPARARLKTWSPGCADECITTPEFDTSSSRLQDLPPDARVLLAGEPADEHCFAMARREEGFFATLFEPEHRYEGYAWYDALPKAGLSWQVEKGDGVLELPDLSGYSAAKVDGLGFDRFPIGENIEEWRSPDRIVALLTTQNGEQEEVEVGCLVFGESGRTFEGDVLVGPGGINVGCLADLIERAIFQASDDWEADSWETQHDEFVREAQASAVRALCGEDDAVAEILRVTAEDTVRWHVPKGKVATLTITWESVAVVLHDEPAEAA